jgi:LPPG:FO 2-phospho-L-lactate transferase
MITALAGGVGAARFLQGLVKLVPEENLTIIVNTGDDIELYGLHISPGHRHSHVHIVWDC